MNVAPIEYDDEEVADLTVTDAQYAAALRDQLRSRQRRLWLVSTDPAEARLEVAVSPVDVAEQSELMAHAALALLEHVLRNTRGKKEVQAILAAAWPWSAHLPEPDITAMVDELGELLLGQPASEQRDAATRQLLIEWEHTAEISANPVLSERLQGPVDLDGPEAPRPGDEAGSTR